MQLNRREFLGSAVAAGAGLLARSGRAEEGFGMPASINDTLATIAEKLRKVPTVAKAELRLVEDPTKGFTQWRWAHFNHNATDDELGLVESANADLLPAMQAAHDVPEAEFDELMLEGVLKGREYGVIRDYCKLHRELLRERLTRYRRDGTPSYYPPFDRVDRELKDPESWTKPVWQVIYPKRQNPRWVNISPLARFGAGFALSRTRKVFIRHAEDAALDAAADKAEDGTDRDEYIKRVLVDRDEYFVRLVRDSKRRMHNLIVGYAHDLTDDVSRTNETQDERISHLIVTVKSLQPEEEIPSAPALPEEVHDSSVGLAPMRH